MAQQGNIDMRSTARIINLPEPGSAREPRLSRDTAYRPIKNGRILTNGQNLGALTTIAISGDICRFSLLEIETDVVIGAMSIEVAAGPLPNGIRICVYKVNADYYPTSLVADGTSDISGNSIGVKNDTFASSKVLRAGVYAIGIRMSNSTMTFRAIGAASCSKLLGRQNSSGYPAITGFQVPYPWVGGTPSPAVFPAQPITPLVNVAQVLHSFTTV
jgi:hypothetical protein